MERKYEFTGETKSYPNGASLQRIVALKDFGKVKKGQLGGWIQSETNLSQEGDCWVFDESVVRENAVVLHNATVGCGSTVSGHALLYDSAIVTGGSIVRDNAKVLGDAIITGYSEIKGSAVIAGHARVIEHSIVTGDAMICEDAEISNRAIIGSHACIRSDLDYIVIGPADLIHRNITFYMDKDVQKGDTLVAHVFGDNIARVVDSFEEKVKTSQYEDVEKKRMLAIIAFVKQIFGVSANA